MDGIFTINDLRGEYWLYTEGDLKVNVGRGWDRGACHFNTSDVHVQAGGPIDTGKVARILAKLMLKFGGSGGYKRMILHRDGKYDLSAADIAAISRTLSQHGFSLMEDGQGQVITWKR